MIPAVVTTETSFVPGWAISIPFVILVLLWLWLGASPSTDEADAEAETGAAPRQTQREWLDWEDDDV